MKKIICLMLCAVFCLSVFSACERAEEGPVTVTVAIETDGLMSFKYLETKAEEMYDIEVEFVTIPDELDKTREYAIQQMRTELMAGKGPDVFFLPAGSETVGVEPLFVDVEESMGSGLFLPLDELIAESELLHMENHFEVIMNAGKYGGEQLVLPLMYEHEVNPVPKSFVRDIKTEIKCPQEILDCGNYELLSAATRRYTWFGAMFGDMVDHEAMKLTISQEEIAENLKTAAEILEYYNGEDEIASSEQAEYDRFSGLNERVLKFISDNPDRFANAYMPNFDGGNTAIVTAFAAINRNAEHPEEAFKVLELLFSYETFRESNLRPKTAMFHISDGIATGKDYYGEADLIDTDFLEQEIENVNAVRFRSDFDELLLRTYVELQYAVMNGEEYDIEEMAARIYQEMQMMAAE